MKIQYASDLHLEFTQNTFWLAKYPLIPVGDILILNGDITILRKGFEKNSFFDFVSENFKQTYIIPGNHEFYGGYDMRNVLELNIDVRHNVKLLNNQAINFGSTKIIFTTLWTHISNSLIEKSLNDFHKSYYKNTKLNTKNYNLLHQECVAFLEKELTDNKAEKTIVVSHHIPTEKANGFIGGDPIMNQGFVVNLESILEKYKIDYWIYGHSHRNKDCENFEIKFRSNQLGYVHWDEHKDFNREAIIEINTPIKNPSKSLFEIKLDELKENKEQIYALMEEQASDPDTIAYYEQQAKELGEIDLDILKNDEKTKIETVTCNNCKTVFSTEHPYKYLTPCKCGNISCDVDKFYIRTAFKKIEDYTYRVNGKIVIIEDNQVWDNDFVFGVNKKNEKK